jgi:Xaa-Pro aminopeptidase
MQGSRVTGHNSSDERSVQALLLQSGIRIGAADLRDLVAGVAAAPTGFEPDSWMALIADQLPPAARAALSALLAKERQRMAPVSGDRSARLAALRAEMRRRRLAGFIIPRSDEHQGEYVAARSERLAWLSGFTGSAGTAVVLRDRAALFVDGRYTTQAAAEVDNTLFAIRHMMHEPMTDWLAAELPPRARLGYDPWLHTPNQVQAFERACGKAGARAVPVDGNLIDCIWLDQPPPPIAPVVPHDDELVARQARSCRRDVA